MVFSSLIFIICFLPAVLILYYTIFRNNRNAQNCFLFIASLGFYAWGEPRFVLVLIISIIGNWYFGLLTAANRERKIRSRWIIILMLIFNLTIIFIFKYLMFTLANINKLFGTDYNTSLILLPIGISFFTFHSISYVIDIYKGKTAVQKNLLNVGLYIAFFPQLVAGPIIRYWTIADQIMGRKETFDKFSQGVCRFLEGLAKKVLLANNFAIIADKAFSLPGSELSVSFAWMGAVAYTLQIYFDFSGYSDMAIGLGKMFGFQFPENFNYPYISKSISEFWRRWHISLGSWFRDYVYFPLGGSRVSSQGRLLFNLFVVWGLTGLWHGANWTFIWWGLLYFVFISFEKLTNIEKRLAEHTRHKLAVSAAQSFYTLLLVMFGWVLFRSASISEAGMYLKTMLFMNGAQLLDGNAVVYLSENAVYFFLGILFSMPVAKLVSTRLEAIIQTGPKRLGTLIDIGYPLTFMFLFLLSLAYLVKGSYNPFIYFNF